MIVSARGRYALHLMTELARSPATLKELAAKLEIPYKFSEAIMRDLSKAGLVEGARGKKGGYRLVRRPEEYPVSEILRVAGNSTASVSCTEAKGACPRADGCPTLPLWRALDDTVNDFLSRYTLADLLRP